MASKSSIPRVKKPTTAKSTALPDSNFGGPRGWKPYAPPSSSTVPSTDSRAKVNPIGTLPTGSKMGGTGSTKVQPVGTVSSGAKMGVTASTIKVRPVGAKKIQPVGTASGSKMAVTDNSRFQSKKSDLFGSAGQKRQALVNRKRKTKSGKIIMPKPPKK